MDFTTLFSSKIETASQTIGAINCFGEYVSSKFNDLANFMAGLGTYASVYVNEANGTLEQKLIIVSSEQYNQAVESPEAELQVRCNDGTGSSAFITITGQDISDAFDEQLSNLRCQEQFIEYCLSVASASVSDFMTRVKTIAPTLSGAIIDKFSRLIEISGSPLECLKNFFSQYRDNSVVYTDQYIELVNPADYVGNVWVSAFTIVADTIAGFFAGAWQGIQDLGGFFKRVLDGIIKLGKWIVSHAFHELTTVYEKACNASIGIMDVPLFQFYGDQSRLSGFLIALGLSAYQHAYSWDHYNHLFDWTEIQTYMQESLENLTKDIFDGVSYNSVTEVIIPASPCDIALRFGKTHDMKYCLSAYIVTDYGSWSSFEDFDNNDRARDSLKSALMYVSSIIPMINVKQNVDDTSTKWNEIVDLFFDYNHLSDYQLVRVLKHASGQFPIPSSNDQLAKVIASLLVYLCLMSKGFVQNQIDVTNTVLRTAIFAGASNTYVLTTQELDYMNELDNVVIDVSIVGQNTFRPYAKRNQLPVTIHYQTTNEQAKEILSAILKIIVAVVAVVATIKFVKWSKKRKKDTLLAHANVDRLSWDVASNPSPENLEAFNKAYRKSRKMDFINGILGIGSSSGESSSSLVGTIANIVAKGTNQSTTAATSTSQISSDMSSLSGKVDTVKILIDGV